jgi:hypothetical protein
MSRDQEASIDTEIGKTDSEDDGVVANEVLILDPVGHVEDEEEAEKLGAEEPQGVNGIAVKDPGPPDGGYGWIVVMYIPLRPSRRYLYGN